MNIWIFEISKLENNRIFNMDKIEEIYENFKEFLKFEKIKNFNKNLVKIS